MTRSFSLSGFKTISFQRGAPIPDGRLYTPHAEFEAGKMHPTLTLKNNFQPFPFILSIITPKHPLSEPSVMITTEPIALGMTVSRSRSSNLKSFSVSILRHFISFLDRTSRTSNF